MIVRKVFYATTPRPLFRCAGRSNR